MKSHRKSRNAEIRNAHVQMAARGRASLSRGRLFEPDVVLTGRAFRRANRLSHTAVELLNVLVRRPDGTAIKPTVEVEIDDVTRAVTGWRVTNI